MADSTALAGIVLEVDGTRLTTADLRPNETGVASASMDVPDSGRLSIRVELWQDGQLAGSGTVEWELRSGTRWGLDLFRQVGDPIDLCFGCEGSREIGLADWARNEADEALWLAWGGVGKDSDIVF